MTKQKKKNPAAVALGRLGGKARLKTMTAKQRQEISQKANKVRWDKFKGGTTMKTILIALVSLLALSSVGCNNIKKLTDSEDPTPFSTAPIAQWFTGSSTGDFTFSDNVSYDPVDVEIYWDNLNDANGISKIPAFTTAQPIGTVYAIWTYNAPLLQVQFVNTPAATPAEYSVRSVPTGVALVN